MLLTIIYLIVAALPFLVVGFTIDKWFFGQGIGFLENSNDFENPNPPGCEKPEVKVLWYPRKCNFNYTPPFGFVSENVAKAIINGGTPPYKIRWDNQAFSPTFTPPAGDQFTRNFNISEGFHHVEVEDKNGQRAFSQFLIHSEPQPILNLRVRHWCQQQPPASRPGRIAFMGGRHLLHFENSTINSGNNIPFTGYQFTVNRLYDEQTNDFTFLNLLTNGDYLQLNSLQLPRGVYEVIIGCYSYLVRIMNKCDIVGTVEEFKPQCQNCT
jgi:hypothetical protein